MDRFLNAISDRLFSNHNFVYILAMQKIIGFVVDCVMLVLGPVLICFVTCLLLCELYAFYTVLLPLKTTTFSLYWWISSVWAIFLITNLFWNYFMCVGTNPGTHDSQLYKELMSEAMEAGELQWTESDSASGGAVYRNRMLRRSAAKQAQAHAAPYAQRVQSWVNLGAYEWGYCKSTRLPKAPRAHFDHITKKLVLNMDHYCPWMFNVVGYRNYRYFILFLFYVLVTCAYGLYLSANAFLNGIKLHGSKFAEVGLSHFSPRMAIAYTFLFSVSIGIAVSILFFWHVYLSSTAQTTIEFYGNQTRKYSASSRGLKYRNPYDLGWKRNLHQIFGTKSVIKALLPSSREPLRPPWPRGGGASNQEGNSQLHKNIVV